MAMAPRFDRGLSVVRSYFILFQFILFFFILFILFYFIYFYFILFYFIYFYLVLLSFIFISGRCELCLKEKYYILFRPESADINSRDEFFSACRHRLSNLLIPRERKKKKTGPGWKQINISSCGLIIIFAPLFSYLFKPEESTTCAWNSQVAKINDSIIWL